MCVKEVPEYYKLVLNILCMTSFVTSSVILLASVGNICVHDKISIENP